tara:strand:+ start:386 stop:586 length:201 start_codon:yes stop_codon:yes gene_type:complete
MNALKENEIETTVNGLIQYYIEEHGELDVVTIWELVCDEIQGGQDYDDYSSEIGIIFDKIIKKYKI